jgi:formylglycine-generating enzyme required for sulfatase activity
VLVAAAAGPLHTQPKGQPTQSVDVALRAIAKITGTREGAARHGTGFVVLLEAGLATVVTSSHVIEGAGFEVTFGVEPSRSFAVQPRDVIQIETDNRNGLAVFRVRGQLPDGLAPLSLASGPSGPSPGDRVFLVGYPEMTSVPLTLAGSFSGRAGFRLVIDRASAEGISGGPVIAGGQAVGLITDTSGQFTYAVHVAVIREFLAGSGVRLPAAKEKVAAPTGGAVAARRAGEVFRDCPECPEMIVIPGGTFTMGSEEEGPMRVLPVSSFAIGRYEVTRADFQAYANNVTIPRGCDGRDAGSWHRPGFTQTATDPVVCVSWQDAAGYAGWLANRTGRAYRLPSEAEWEYAARGGTSALRGWTDEADACAFENVASEEFLEHGRVAVHACADGFANTAPVGKFRANAFGLFDTLGNAAEWVEDCYHDNYAGAPPTAAAWTTGECRDRVLRGGWFGERPWLVRATYRFKATGTPWSMSGLRVAMTLP